MVRGMKKLPPSLSITRQAIQEIWHVVCHAEKNEVLGVLGMTENGLICRVQHLEVLSPENMQEVAKQWIGDDIHLQGNFQSNALDRTMFDEVKHIAPRDAWLALVLNMDTQGCLKSSLYGLKNNECVELPMTLVDVGQHPLKG